MSKLLELEARVAILEESEKKYNTIEEIPDFGKLTIKKLVAKKLLAGDGTGLGLKYSDIRTYVILDRAGLFDW